MYNLFRVKPNKVGPKKVKIKDSKGKEKIILKKQLNQSTEGETIEAKVRKIMKHNEPITDGAPLLYADRSEGVDPAYNIRTDRWELAAGAMDKVTKDTIAKRKQPGTPGASEDKGKTASNEPPKGPNKGE